MSTAVETSFGTCEFLRGSADPGDYPATNLPEIGFAGRSNVGKSSLINALTRRKKLARTSNTPGRTREINFFTVGSSHILADLPGYGYARMPKAELRRCSLLIDDYLRNRAVLRRLFLLIDARRGIMPVDQEFMGKLGQVAVAFQIVLTKTDKLHRDELSEAQFQVAERLAEHPAALPTLIATSSVTRAGLDQLANEIAAIDSLLPAGDVCK